jgi:alkylation response protein AidB-like acyl-CoA dehydrogenase
MNFRFSPEEEAFRQEVRQFLGQELPPGWDEEFDEETEEGTQALAQMGARLSKKMGERHWLAMAWPPEYGGHGASHAEQVIFSEEVAYKETPVVYGMGVNWVGPSIMLYGTDEQKKRFLPPIASGEEFWCTLYSEPGAGSDLAALGTRAVADGDEFVINGEKVWTTWGHLTHWGWLAARTDPDAPKHKGISTFVVPMNAPGMTILPLVNMAGHHGFNQVYFDNVRIPKNYLVGELNRGWYQLAVALDFERSSSGGVAHARRILDDLMQFIRENRSLLEGRPAWRHGLAEALIEVDVGQQLAYRVLSMQQAGQVPNYESSISRVYAAELDQRVTRFAIGLLGLYGQLHPKSKWAKLKGRMERAYLGSVGDTIATGTSEIQRNIIATRGLGLPRG